MGGNIEKRATSSVDACSELPTTVTYVQVKDQIHQSIRDNQRMSTDEIGSEIVIRHGKKRRKITSRSKRRSFLVDKLEN
jgi:hypothetical protein